MLNSTDQKLLNSDPILPGTTVHLQGTELLGRRGPAETTNTKSRIGILVIV